MKARIDIDMNGAAFAERPTDELHRILWELCGKLKREGHLALGGAPFHLHDINGNKVGKLTITGEK